MSLALHGYRYSVYVRIARLVLAEKGVAYDRVEVNPFAPDMPASYLALHPFGRVPALVHDGFALYETAAITRYVDRAFPGPALQPAEAKALARMRRGEPVDEAEVGKGLAASVKVLAALEELASKEAFLTGPALSLADLH